MREVLVADCVGKRFGDRWVLHSASLRATTGQVRALLGRNGAGKSTLLRIATGLMQPDGGTVRLNGAPLERANFVKLARGGLCLIPDHDLLSNAFSIREQFAFAGGTASSEIEHVADRLTITHLLDSRPFELSSGERRRAEVGFAMMLRPSCVIADEPLRNVSPIDADVLLKAFLAMAREGCAVVVTGHEVPALLAAVDHVTWCTAGTTYEMGPPFMARTDQRFVRDYLGPAGG